MKFVLAAWNEGDFTDAEKYVAPGCAIYTNGLAYEPGPEEDGPAMVEESIDYWRTIVPDIKMELSQEIREKDRIAIEWLITGTHTGKRPDLPASGNAIELQGAAFLTLEDDRIVEAWSVFDSLALAVTGAAEGAGLVAGARPGLVRHRVRAGTARLSRLSRAGAAPTARRWLRARFLHPAPGVSDRRRALRRQRSHVGIMPGA